MPGAPGLPPLLWHTARLAALSRRGSAPPPAQVVRANPLEKSKYIRCILTLFNSPSPAVTYECASVLIALSSSNTAVKAAATSYTNLLASQSDNNIKLIVLERLQDLRKQHPKVLQDMIMDIIRGLSSANLDIRTPAR